MPIRGTAGSGSTKSDMDHALVNYEYFHSGDDRSLSMDCFTLLGIEIFND